MSDDTTRKPTIKDYTKLTEQELTDLMKGITDAFKNQLYNNTYRYLYQPYPYPKCKYCGGNIGMYGWCACRQHEDFVNQRYWSNNWGTSWGTSKTIIPKIDPDTTPPDADMLLEDDEDDDDDIPTGWLCPICKNVYAPSVKQCPEC